MCKFVAGRLFFASLALLGMVFSCFACSFAFAGENPALKDEGRFSLGVVKHASLEDGSSLKVQDPELIPQLETVTAAPLASQGPEPAGKNLGLNALLEGKGELSASLSGRESAGSESQGELVEYEIDWSKWFSTLADRWHLRLRTMERKKHVVFVTTCPAQIRFTCFSDGSIGFVSLQKSSGVDEYDSMQIKALLACAPLPPFPTGTKRSKITVVQGWESRRKRLGEKDFELGSFGKEYPKECISKWIPWI